MEFLRDILEEHLEEADFLYTQRRNALMDDDYDLGELAALEERMLAHVDGLVIAGGEAWALLAGLLSGGDEGEAFTAALVALASGDADRRGELLTAFAKASGETLNGLRAAFCLSGLGDLDEPLRDLVAEAEAPTAAAVLEILAFHRRGLSPEELGGVLGSEDTGIRTAGLRAAAALGWRDFQDRAKDFLTADDPELVVEAVRTGYIFNDDSGLVLCRSSLAGGRDLAAELQIWLGLAGFAQDVPLLAAGLDSPELGRGAVIALGWLGRVEAVDALLARLQRGECLELERQIGAAVTRVTGVDLAGAGLTRVQEEPPPEATGSDDPADPVQDPDEALPWPDSERLATWWRDHRPEFRAGERYRIGRILDRGVLLDVLARGGLSERHFAACELARMTTGEALFETRALAWSQSRRLARLAGR